MSRVTANLKEAEGKMQLSKQRNNWLESRQGGSLIGTIFEGKVESAIKVGTFDGIRPSICGWAQITGHNTIFVDDKDPLRHGFQLA